MQKFGIFEKIKTASFVGGLFSAYIYIIYLNDFTDIAQVFSG